MNKIIYILCLSLCFLHCQMPVGDAKKQDKVSANAANWKDNYDWVGVSFAGWAIKVKKNNQYGLVNSSGKVLISVRYNDIESDVRDEYFDIIWAKKGDKYGYLNEKEEAVIPFVYSGAKSFSEGVAAVKKGTQWGFIDEKGNEVLPFIYNEAESYYNNLCLVKKGAHWGFIDEQGNVKIPFIYEEIERYGFGSDNYCAVMKGGKWGYIDKNNKTIIPFIYDKVEDLDLKYIAVEKDGKMGVIDFTGKEIIPIKFYAINLLANNAMRIYPHKESTIETSFTLDSLGNEIKDND